MSEASMISICHIRNPQNTSNPNNSDLYGRSNQHLWTLYCIIRRSDFISERYVQLNAQHSHQNIGYGRHKEPAVNVYDTAGAKAHYSTVGLPPTF
jgi:hypothetical protein